MERTNEGINVKEFEECKACGDFQKLDSSCLMQKGRVPLIIIGESPAKDGWVVSKRAFYNKDGKLQASGKVLSRLLAILNMKIEDINFTECCKCVIQDRKILDKCSSNCKHFLYKQLEDLSWCDIIITLGLHPTQTLLNKKIDRFSDYVGKVFSITIGNKEFQLVPIYHPSPVNPMGYKDNVPIFKMIKTMLESNSMKKL